jgi:hypothetical protein
MHSLVQDPESIRVSSVRVKHLRVHRVSDPLDNSSRRVILSRAKNLALNLSRSLRSAAARC